MGRHLPTRHTSVTVTKDTIQPQPKLERLPLKNGEAAGNLGEHMLVTLSRKVVGPLGGYLRTGWYFEKHPGSGAWGGPFLGASSKDSAPKEFFEKEKTQRFKKT